MNLEREDRLCLGVLALCFAYAALRYVGFGPHPPVRLPAWVMNKALALSCVLALGLGLRAQARGASASGRRYLTSFRRQALAHALLSVALLSPAYYPELHGGGFLSLAGELMLVAGAWALLTLIRLPGLHKGMFQLALAGLLIHLAAIAGTSWFHPATWPGWMPPITLLGFLAAAFALVEVCRTRPAASV